MQGRTAVLTVLLYALLFAAVTAMAAPQKAAKTSTWPPHVNRGTLSSPVEMPEFTRAHAFGVKSLSEDGTLHSIANDSEAFFVAKDANSCEAATSSADTAVPGTKVRFVGHAATFNRLKMSVDTFVDGTSAAAGHYVLCARASPDHQYESLTPVHISNLPTPTASLTTLGVPAREEFTINLRGHNLSAATRFTLVAQQVACSSANNESVEYIKTYGDESVGPRSCDNGTGICSAFALKAKVSRGITLKLCLAADADSKFNSVDRSQLNVGSQVQYGDIEPTGTSDAEDTFHPSGFSNGQGTRSYESKVNFEEPFGGSPKVLIGFSGLAVPSDSDTRINCSPVNADATSMRVKCITYADARVLSFKLTWLATFTDPSLANVAAGLVNYSSASAREWWIPSEGELSLDRHQLKSVSFAKPFEQVPRVATGLTQIHASRNDPDNYTGIVVATSAKGFEHEAVVQSKSRVQQLSYSWLAFPPVSRSGYTMETGDYALRADGDCAKIEFPTAFAPGTEVKSLVFATGWEFNSHEDEPLDFDLAISTTTEDWMEVCLVGGTRGNLKKVTFNWAAFGIPWAPIASESNGSKA